jgi:hypothetical protein
VAATNRPGPERTLEVSCLNCGAKFVAYYGYAEENVEAVEVRSFGLCLCRRRSPTGAGILRARPSG